ncbi:HAMP domain-containing sensor histidine kinase [Oscillatoria amoena NRMC-F 0135]|nr:HAMP domain-containing sensor histidine kinase [Oscillatoria amoena NRMC-F 0135]
MPDFTTLQTELDALRQQVEELTRNQRQLLTIASHDIKSPFNRMHALLQLVQMNANNFTDEQKNYLEKMHIVIGDGMAMIRNLIDYRNLESGIQLMPESVDLEVIINASLKSVEGVARKKQVTLIRKNQERHTIYTDRQCLQRALDNILSNAMKFSFPDKTVIVRTARMGTDVAIEVEDEARGFLQAEREQLFQKFSKFSNRPTGGESSTGLGLYIAQSMMQKINGRVECITTEGVGSVFRIVFPVSLQDMPS